MTAPNTTDRQRRAWPSTLTPGTRSLAARISGRLFGRPMLRMHA